MILNPLLDFVFPNSCLECQRLLAEPNQILCLRCYTQLPFTHWKWGATNPMYEKLNSWMPIEAAISLFYFRRNNLTQKVLHALKYRNRKEIGEWLSEELYRRMSEFSIPLEAILIVPIHPKKLKSRGYNQNTVFSQHLADLLGVSFYPQALKRTKHQKSQTLMHRGERLKRLEETFAIHQLPKKEKHVLLIDDVCTTGSTLLHCARLLLEQNKKVSIATIAYAI